MIINKSTSFPHKIGLTILLVCVSTFAHSQVVISLLFGEKLNQPGLEFGLEGGFNWSQLDGFENERMLRSFNLGFYFDIRVQNSFSLYTGVLVKSSMGMDKLTEADINMLSTKLFENEGDYSQVLNYFLLPVLAKYKFKNYFYVEAGPQFGLLNDAYLEFNYNLNDTKARLQTKNRDMMNRIDAGVSGGLGYTFLKGAGVTLGIKYYYGFIDVVKNKPGSNNSSYFVKMNVPIGAAKKNG